MKVQVGNYIKVLDNGFTYSSFGDFLEIAGVKHLRPHFRDGVVPNRREIYKVIAIGNHPSFNSPQPTAVIQSTDTGEVFVVNIGPERDRGFYQILSFTLEDMYSQVLGGMSSEVNPS